MTWPNVYDYTANLDAAGDSPALAQPDLLQLGTDVSAIQAMLGEPGGPASLTPIGGGLSTGQGGAGKVLLSQLPTLLSLIAATGATTLADLLVALGISNDQGKLSVDFSFAGAMQVAADGNDFQKCGLWENRTGFTYTIQNAFITRCDVPPLGGLAIFTVETRSAKGGILLSSNTDLVLVDGGYNIGVDISLTVPAGGTATLYLSSATTPPENVNARIEGYIY